MQHALKIGITGASGFIGKHFVEKFTRDGYSVNAYVRDSRKIEFLQNSDTKFNVFEGDITDKEKVSLFVRNCDIIIHLAAGTSGVWENYYNTTVMGSELLFSLCQKYNIKKFIYISSISVYDLFITKRKDSLDENSPFDPHLDLRGWYAKSKALGEQVITKQFENSTVDTIILRPGLVYAYNMSAPLMGCGIIRGGRGINLGMRKKRIPFIHIDDLYSAVISVMESDLRAKIYNVVSNEQPETQKIIALYNKFSSSKIKMTYIPRIFFIPNHFLNRVFPKNNLFGRYNFLLCRTQKSIYYSNDAIKQELKWKTRVSFEETMKQMVEFHQSKVNIGIVGCGFAFSSLHLPVILGNPQIKVKALFDINTRNTWDLKNKHFKDAEILKNINELKKSKYDLDFIVVSTPPATHFEIAKNLIKERYNLLIEKPLCLNYNEAIELQKLANDYDAKICVVNNYRFRNNVIALKSALQSKKNIESVSVKFYSGPIVSSERDWRNKLKEVLLYEMAYHFIDIAVEIAGKVSTIEHFDVNRDRIGVITDVYAVLTTENDVKIYLDLQLHPPYAQTRIEVRHESRTYVSSFYPESFRERSGSSSPVHEIKHNIKTILSYIISNKIKKDKNISHQRIYDGFIKSLKYSQERIPVEIRDILPTMDLIEKITLHKDN